METGRGGRGRRSERLDRRGEGRRGWWSRRRRRRSGREKLFSDKGNMLLEEKISFLNLLRFAPQIVVYP